MKFKQRTIAPAGRNKYGNYMSQGNVTKSVMVTTYAGNDTTTSIGDTGGTEEEQPVYFYCMLSSPNFTFNAVDLANEVTAATQVIAYKGYNKAYTYVCDMESVTAVTQDGVIQSLTAPANQGIIGIPTGMAVSFTNNGTSASTIVFTVTSSLVGDGGTIFIPVQVYKRDDDIPLPDDLYNWYEHKDDCEQVWLEYTWYANRASSTSGGTGPQGPSGESPYYLSLTNDNASVNADASGNVITGFTLPACQAKLYHGTTLLTGVGVTYNVDWGSASGVSTAKTSGVLNIIFGPDFNFTGSSMSIAISGITSNKVRDSKVMNIIKSYPGADGEPAVSYWLETNYNSVIFDPNTNTPNPPAITVSGYKQVGGNQPEPETGATFKYQYHRRGGTFTDPSNFPSTGLTITSANCVNYDRIRVSMFVDSAQKDQEDVDILVDGINGTDGVDGRQGAAIRGPYDYYEISGSTQCWCAGESGYSCEDCSKWIDVVLKDNVYYYCNTTYYGTLTSHFPEYWTSGASFDFVATRVLLASAASINFLSNNELYLGYKDSGGTYHITGGAMGGEGISFWAGSDEPSDAPFSVDYNGTIQANNGVFGGYIQMRYTDISELQTGGTSNYKKYYLDTRAYVIGYHGTNYYNTIVLPNPSSDLNGFMYSLLIIGHRTSGQHPDEDVSCYAEVLDGSHSIIDYVYQPYGSRGFSKAGLYGGKYQFVCANVDGSYKWLLTEATGGADMYGTTHDNTETNWRCFRPVFGYNDADGTFPSGGGTPLIKNIKDGTGTDNHTMYIQQ